MNPWLKRSLVALAVATVILNAGGIVTVRIQAAAERRPSPEELLAPVPHLVDYEQVKVPTPDGVELDAWFMPGSLAGPVAKQASVLVLPGSAMAGHPDSALKYGPMLTAEGYNVIAFSYRGRGQSDGATRNGILLGLDQLIDDATAVLTHLRTRPEVGNQPVAAVGCSLGTGVAIGLAARTHEPRALFLDSPWNDFISSQEGQADTPDRPWPARIPFFWHLIRWWGSVAFQTDVDRTEPATMLRQAGNVPLFIVHRIEDNVLGSRQAELLYTQATGPKQLWLVPGRGHCDSRYAAEPEFRDQLLAFLGEHLRGQPQRLFHVVGEEQQDRELALSVVNETSLRLPLEVALHRPERRERAQQFQIWLEPGTQRQGYLLPTSSRPEFMTIRRQYNAVERGPSWAEALTPDAQAFRKIGEADAHLVKREPGEAQQSYQVAQRLAPENPRFHFEAGRYFFSQGFLDEASDAFFKTLSAPIPSEPGPDPREWKALSHVYLGRISDIRDNRPDAIRSYELAKQFNIPSATYWAEQGITRPFRAAP